MRDSTRSHGDRCSRCGETNVSPGLAACVCVCAYKHTHTQAGVCAGQAGERACCRAAFAIVLSRAVCTLRILFYSGRRTILSDIIRSHAGRCSTCVKTTVSPGLAACVCALDTQTTHTNARAHTHAGAREWQALSLSCRHCSKQIIVHAVHTIFLRAVSPAVRRRTTIMQGVMCVHS